MSTMHVALLPKTLIIDGNLVKTVGPFPSIGALMAWAEAYEVEHPDAFPDKINVTTIYVPTMASRLPSSAVEARGGR